MEEDHVRVERLDEIIDYWEEATDKNGNIVFASSRIEEKFEDAGWAKNDARIKGVRLVKLTEDLSNYAAPIRQTAWFAKNNNNGTCFLGFIEKSPTIKPIETIYKGYRFRSRLEARWAVFFDYCHEEWEYEPEGFDLGNGVWYLPDFYLPKHKLWVEVKGSMTKTDEEKILKFSGYEYEDGMLGDDIKNPIYVIGDIPKGSDGFSMMEDMERRAYSGRVPIFNSCLYNGDYFGWFPLVNSEGYLEFCGDDGNYMTDVDWDKTKAAFSAALGARFEHGENGEPKQKEKYKILWED